MEASQQHLLRIEDWSSFLNFKSPIVDSIVLKSKLFYKSREEAFKVNLRTSSFQVRVADTGRIRELIGFWKKRKRARKKNEIGHRNHRRKPCDLRRGLTRATQCCLTCSREQPHDVTCAPSAAHAQTIPRSGYFLFFLVDYLFLY